MSDDTFGKGRDIRSRFFRWYWRRLARRKKPAVFQRLARARQAELDILVRRAEAKLATKAARGSERDTWRARCLTFAIQPAAFEAPQSGVKLGDDLAVYHDDTAGMFTLSQRPNRLQNPRNRFEVFFESYTFEGSYLSCVLALPASAPRPGPGRPLRVALDLVASRPLKAYLRLNAEGGKGRDTLYAEAHVGNGAAEFDFDFSFMSFEPEAGDAIWLDLIVDRPHMVSFSLRELALSLQGETR